jgi:transposase
VAVLGASNYTYAEATWTQGLADWIESHQRAFRFFGGVTETVVPDNLKTGITHPHRYEPEINRSYAEMAAHYGVAVLPTRVARPRDKAKVENAVLVVERWILARLRHQPFFSLAALNRAIAELRSLLNERPFKKLPGCRLSLYQTLDRPALSPLPATPYVLATWKPARVSIDYHIELERCYYSVPYQLVKQQVEARLTARTVEVFHRGQRVASHRRVTQAGQYSTLTEHMPRPHREYAEWTPRRLVQWARKTGPATAELVAQILASRRHPQQSFRACLGIIRLGKDHGAERLEAACTRALHIRAFSYKSIASILQHRLDQQPLPATEPDRETIVHANLRGPEYYE